MATTTIALTVIVRPVTHLTLTAWSDGDDRQPLPTGTVDDASNLNQTKVTIKQVKSQPGVAEVILQSVLRDALSQGKKVACMLTASDTFNQDILRHLRYREHPVQHHRLTQ
ncbi:MAG: hypothetical protein V7K97_01600 [Nostoc sp.]|uniref:hypothetical protein n=1 Tax=Nostoc sp. TaxID=1180 RepID=UPI002FF82F0D